MYIPHIVGTIFSAVCAMRRDAAENHDADRDRHDHAVDPAVVGEERDALLEQVERLAHLERTAAGQRTADAEDGEEQREEGAEPLPTHLAEPVLQVVHRAARHPAVGVDLAVALAQGALGELERHPEQARADHPERRARAADRDRDRHARDVAEPDRRRERRGERLEVRDLAVVALVRVGVLATDDRDRVAEQPEVDEAHAQREEDRGADEPEDDEGDRVLGRRTWPHSRVTLSRLKNGTQPTIANATPNTASMRVSKVRRFSLPGISLGPNTSA
jgi:hypothetical protein